jgi:PQQ-dependent dehydrogenase (methanol/ethanol family)
VTSLRLRVAPSLLLALALGGMGTNAGADPALSGAEANARGWFTADQAAHGARDYKEHCSGCHGPDLAGGKGPALVGDAFLAKWGRRTLSELYGFAHGRMPLNAPGALEQQQYADIAAYVLSRNGFVAGTTPLAAGTELGRVLRPSVEARDLQRRVHSHAVQRPPSTATLAAPPAASASEAPRAPATLGPTQAEIEQADTAGSSWPFFNKGLKGYRYSPLAQINARNAAALRPVCVFQTGEVGAFQSGIVLHDGVGYATTMRGTYAFDATTCRALWSHQRAPAGPEVTNNNKGPALAGGRVLRGSQDGHLYALDMRSGGLLWDRKVADSAIGEFVTAAPIVWRDLVFVGKAGGEFGIVGEMMAFRAEDGTKLWGTPLVATGAMPGAETWKDPDSARRGGGSTWSSYALDSETGVLYVPVGNPAPDFNRAVRPGANLYTNSVLALDARTGAVKWWYQLVPGDQHDWDTTVVALFDGKDGRKLIAAAGKDGVLHVLDRAKGTPLFQVPVTTRLNTDAPITPAGTRFCPGASGGVAWNGPAYHPGSGLLYVNAVDWCTTAALGPAPQWVKGETFTGLKEGTASFDPVEKAGGWTNAVEAGSGKMAWRYRAPTPMLAAVTPTAGGVLFTADLNGELLVLDAANGKVLYRFNTGGAMAAGIITYEIKGRQYVAAASGNASRTTWFSNGAASVFVFALGQ